MSHFKFVTLITSAIAALSVVAENPLRPPAVPLVANHPFFSVWSAADRLTDVETTHWSGAKQPLSILLKADGKTYRLCGKEPLGVPALPQLSTEVRALTTVCRFAEGGLSVELRFMTPKFADNLDVFSRPVTYLSVKVSGAEKWSVKTEISPAFATNNDRAEMVTNHLEVAGMPTVAIGRKNQKPLSESGDRVRCNWGWAYLVGPAVSGNTAMFILAYDDIKSVRFFGSELNAWWRRKGMKFNDMLAATVRDYPALVRKADAFDRGFFADLKACGGEKYARLGALAFRQSFAACILVADPNGQPMYFSKENASNGCMGTVDVFYPQLPHLLLSGSTLTRATLAPILIYASSPRWPWSFAPHDIGRYPLGDKQRYAGGETAVDETSLMPVEECGNMLIALGALSHMEGSAEFASVWWPTVTKWVKYLEKFGFDPGDQLCTDDFAGHLAHNVNLSAKAILAIACYGRMAGMRGEKKTEEKYISMARSFARQWVTTSAGGREGASKLSFEKSRRGFEGRDMWSQKYNLVWDRILGLGIFPPEVGKREVSAYKRLLLPYGLPLDNRYNYTKADWTVWSATLNGERADFETIINRLYRFANETPDRIPLSDWYWADSSRFRGFVARSVVGGFYLPLLYDAGLWKKHASRDKFETGRYAPLKKARGEKGPLSLEERTAGPQRISFADTTSTRVDPPAFDVPFQPIGVLRPKTLREIGTSRWSIGLQSPRPEDWLDTVPEIGIKRGRMALGTRQRIGDTGKWNFDWHDKHMERASSLGMTIQLEVDAEVKGLAGAAVKHFAGRVNEWCVRISSRVKTVPEAEAAAALAHATAREIRAVVPKAVLTVHLCTGPNVEAVTRFAEALKRAGGERDFAYVSISNSTPNPEDTHKAANECRNVVRKILPGVRMAQKGDGAPSERAFNPKHLSSVYWTERKQAKWLLRRLLNDYSYLYQMDVMLAADRPDFAAGLVKMEPAPHRRRRAVRAKTAYYAVQNLVSVFNDATANDSARKYGFIPSGSMGRQWHFFRHKRTGTPLFVWWKRQEAPRQDDKMFPFTLTVNGEGFKDPVWVDILSGRVYAIDGRFIKREGGKTIYRDIPGYDSPVLITDRAALDLMPLPKAMCVKPRDPLAAEKARALQRMETPWTKAAERGETWKSYPRPQLVRKGWTNLNGLWDYRILNEDDPRPETWQGKIRVPFSVESTISGVGHLLEAHERLWYRRTFDASPMPGKRMLLHFGAVDYRTQVFVNGKEALASPHVGGDMPFTVDITDFVRKGENELVVAVWDPTDVPGIGFQAVGKQARQIYSCFYRRSSGIWQTVWLEETPATYIAGYRATSDIAGRSVKVEVSLAGTGGAAEIDLAVRDGDRIVARGRATAENPVTNIKIPDAKLWSPASPHLYDLDIRVRTPAGTEDAVKGYFGMREIGWKKDSKGVPRLTLNGEFIYMHGPLSQGWWPDGILTPPSEEGMRYDVDKMRELGFNVIRKHIKVEPAQFYRYCDEIGMLLWQDMPSGKNERDMTGIVLKKGESFRNDRSYTSVRYAGFRAELKEMIDHLSYFPSIVVWVPYNEAWGQPGEGQSNETLRWVKSYDPTRLVDGPSGWNDYGFGDMRDRHNYPEPEMEPVSNLVDRVSVLGEYGSIQYALPGHTWIKSRRNRLPQDEARAKMLKRYGELMDQTAALVRQGLGASIYTMIVDSDLGVGGFLTYDRLPKFDPEEILPFNKKVFEAAEKEHGVSKK